MAPAEQFVKPSESVWGGVISVAQANEFARGVTPIRADQELIAKNLLAFPSNIRVRGIFFEGLSRVVEKARGPGAMVDLLARAGITVRTTAFRVYPHQDFYRLYYLAARLLFPAGTFAEGLRRTARTFFPIFKDSIVGRTMGAFMGDRPTTMLPLLARAYNLSVEGNEHRAELVSDNELDWRCAVEPVQGYVDTFTGIVEGTVPPEFNVKVKVEERSLTESVARYRLRISW